MKNSGLIAGCETQKKPIFYALCKNDEKWVQIGCKME